MLEGKVAYVTGATRGIGAEVVRTFAANRATVVINGRDESRTQTLVSEIGSEFGVECLGVIADQRDPEAIKGAYQQIFSAYQRLDVLVNNAGILSDGLLGMISEEAITSTFEVNALSVVRNIQGAARLMQRAGSGSIISMSSIIGLRGNPGQVVYAGSKAAIVGVTMAAAKELAPSGIRVNAIAPGLIDTDMVRSLPVEKLEDRLALVAMGRIGRTADVANVALFLASDLSAYVTGQTIGVDGGMVV